jgi:Alw26I/Eco31I/Esp3I family type II restriction m6 adenine DNA methyltransferase
LKHTTILKSISQDASVKNALVRATGRFYTPPIIADSLVDDVVSNLRLASKRKLRVVDPFCGDGRLIIALLRKLALKLDLKKIRWEISFWDYDENAVILSQQSISKTVQELGLNASLDPKCQDSFLLPQEYYGEYDCVITNPPWESIKPDSRELSGLTVQDRKDYLAGMKEYDLKLANALPFSQPRTKYAGWGTNLSRCGTELALKLVANRGICGLVIPLSLLMDQSSIPLRRWMFTNAEPLSISSYPAEAKLFPQVDQNIVTVTLRKNRKKLFSLKVNTYDRDINLTSESSFKLTTHDLEGMNYCLPVSSSLLHLKLIRKWEQLGTIGNLESGARDALWAGRELDETRYKEFTSEFGQYQFVKGRMVKRFLFPEPSPVFLNPQLRQVPQSALHYRIAWRDVSRRSQARRMQATIISPNVVTGNSLHVGFFKDDNCDRLRALLAIMNSLPFEFQVRSRLGTGHVSLGIVRCIKIPCLDNLKTIDTLSKLVASLMSDSKNRIEDEIKLEIEVSRLYNISREEYVELLNEFDGLPETFKTRLLLAYNSLRR